MDINLISFLNNPVTHVAMHYLIAGSKVRMSFYHLDGNGKETSDVKKIHFTNYEIPIDELKNNPFRFQTVKSSLVKLFQIGGISYGEIEYAGKGVINIIQMDHKTCPGKLMHNALVAGGYMARANYVSTPYGGYIGRISDGYEVNKDQIGLKDEHVKKICASVGIAVSVTHAVNSDGKVEVQYHPQDSVSRNKLREIIMKLPPLPGTELAL